MINTRALTNPSPADANLRTGIDPLGMLREGSYDSNRFSYFHGKFKTRNTQFSASKNPLRAGGIIPFPTPSMETPNHPMPLNALVDKPLPIYDLYHTPLAPQYNPLAVTLDSDFIKKYNTVNKI